MLITLSLGIFISPAFTADVIKLAITGPYSGGSPPVGTSF